VKKYLQKRLNPLWLKASVVGSLWASIEIVAGSFLHNLKIPLSGTVLSFVSVYLLIAFYQLWNEKGLIWRAGLICALMKSLSPSAVILGPMIGIFGEAVLLELFIFILGRNPVAYTIGGAVAVLSALLHKVVSLLILYGFDFVKILSGLYQFVVKQTNLTQLEPHYFIGGLVGFYLVLGGTAAICGYWSGKKYMQFYVCQTYVLNVSLLPQNHFFKLTAEQSYSIFFLLTHLVSIVICLLLINSEIYFVAVPACIGYIVFCAQRYKSALRHFKKTTFWIYFVVITLTAAFLLNGYKTGSYFSFEGFVIGAKMNFRAFVILVGFSALSVELKNPLIKTVLYKRGFANIYQSLSLAFSALPSIVLHLPKPREIFKDRNRLLKTLFDQSHQLLQQFEYEHKKRSEIYIITGALHEGKTTFAHELILKLLEEKRTVKGFLSLGINQNNRRVGFELLDIETGKRYELCSKSPHKDWKQHGGYYFDTGAFEFGNNLLINASQTCTDLIVVDEIGHLELIGGGWATSIEHLYNLTSIPQLWLVRKELIESVLKKWNIRDAHVFDISIDTVADTLKSLNL